MTTQTDGVKMQNGRVMPVLQAAPASFEVYPKVLRSMENKSTLFYHVHIPKTGGTTVANLLLADICAPFEDNITPLNWKSLCNTTCEMGLTDNEFTCQGSAAGSQDASSREWVEHNAYALNRQRAETLMSTSGAQSIVYVTTLRRGSQRLLSQWAFEVELKLWIPEDGIEPFSNESLRLYLTNGTNLGGGWIGKWSASIRNNLQVAQLASVYYDLMAEDNVTREHLELAKQTLMTGQWVIGFTDCMDTLQDKLLQHSRSLHGSAKAKAVPPREHWRSTPSDIKLDSMTEQMLDDHCALDNELSLWAWRLAEQRQDPRFTEIC